MCEGDNGDKINFCDLQAGGGWEHQRAVQYFQESIMSRNKFMAVKAESWEQFKENEGIVVKEQNIDVLHMGEHLCLQGPKQEGNYYLRTHGMKPFSLS